MKQKGFAPLIIIITLLILAIAIVGGVSLSKKSSYKENNKVQPTTIPKNFGSILRPSTSSQPKLSRDSSNIGLIKLPRVNDPQIGDVGSWSNLPPELSFFKEIGNGQKENFSWVPTTSTLLTRITSEDKKILENKNIVYAMLPNTDKDIADFNELFSITNKITSYLENYYEKPEHYHNNQGHYPFPKEIIYSRNYNPNLEANLILAQANVNLTYEQTAKIKDKIYYKTDGAATNAYFAFKMPLDINRNGQEDDYLIWEATCGFASGLGHYLNKLPEELKRLEPGYPLDDPNFNEEKFKKWSLEYCPMNFPL